MISRRREEILRKALEVVCQEEIQIFRAIHLRGTTVGSIGGRHVSLVLNGNKSTL